MNIDSYIDQFEGEVKQRLLIMRKLVKTNAPEANEGFMYGLVGYKLNGCPLVYFGGFKNHVGLYATPNGHQEFADKFAKYKQGKGSVQFPNNQPLPIDLIEEVIRYRKAQVEHE